MPDNHLTPRRSCAIVATCLLVGCGGGGSTESPTSTDLFPLSAGDTATVDTLECNVVCIPGTASKAVTAEVVGGQTIYTVSKTPQGTSERFTKSPGEVIEHPDPSDPFAVALGPRVILKQPWKAGDEGKKEVVVRSDIATLPAGELTVSFSYHVHGTESVTTPLGKFEAVKVSSGLDASLAPDFDPAQRFWWVDARTDWYVPGIGRVTRVRQMPASTAPRPRDSTEVLKAYQIR